MTTTDTAENPRAVTGNNEAPDYAQRVTADMTRDYAEISKTVTDLLNEARAAPATVNSDEEMGVCARIIKRLRDTAARAEAFRVKEKEPYLRGGEAVDTFFHSMIAKCARQPHKKTDKPGAADILQAHVHDFNERKLAEETRKREEAERIARDNAARAEQVRLAEEQRLRDEEQKRLDSLAAAEASKKPKTAEKHEAKAAEHAGNIAVQGGKVAEARAIEDAARADLSDARAASTAKPADMVRTRLDDGVTSTMAKEPFVQVVDATKLNFLTLAPFFKADHIEMALKNWAKTTQYKTPMTGAIIEMRRKTVIR